jgi:AcrR family transcriptional regulator
VTDDRPLRADARRNRDRLLQTAATAFAADGLSVSLDEIARRAGVGPGTLYRHFPTKEALFEAVVHERLDQLLRDARGLGDAADPQAALFGFIERLVSAAAAKQDLVDALAGANIDVTGTVAATAGELRGQIGHLLARAQDARGIRDDITLADLMALLSGLLSALRARGRADAGRMLSVLCDGLLPRTA